MSKETKKGDALIEARTLRGFHDKLPQEALIKERMLSTLKGVFESFAYVPIETPHLEYAEIIVKESSEEIKKQLYRFEDNGGRDVALRFDLTVPFARFIVQHRSEVGIPFKRYAIGNVFRGERPQAGRYREFTQCDFDFVGTESLGADAEIIEVMAACMTALGLHDYTIRINNRKAMNGLAQKLGITSQAADLLRIVDKLEKIGENETKAALQEELKLGPKQLDELFEFISISKEHQGASLFTALAPYKNSNELLRRGITELEELFQILEATDIERSAYTLDLSIARGLAYYTGTVYETELSALPDFGSICSGGRYDNLTGTFSCEALPGVGASVGIDRLIAALQELKLVKGNQTPAKILIINDRESLIPELHRIAHYLRHAGIATEIFPDPAKMKKQFEYAERKGHPYILFLEEKAGGGMVFKLRCSSTREQRFFDNVEELAGVF